MRVASEGILLDICENNIWSWNRLAACYLWPGLVEEDIVPHAIIMQHDTGHNNVAADQWGVLQHSSGLVDTSEAYL